MSQKSSPPTTFDDIFPWAESFCIKFCTFIGNLYPHMSTDFRLFIFTFNEIRVVIRLPVKLPVTDLPTFFLHLMQISASASSHLTLVQANKDRSTLDPDLPAPSTAQEEVRTGRPA